MLALMFNMSTMFTTSATEASPEQCNQPEKDDAKRCNTSKDSMCGLSQVCSHPRASSRSARGCESPVREGRGGEVGMRRSCAGGQHRWGRVWCPRACCFEASFPKWPVPSIEIRWSCTSASFASTTPTIDNAPSAASPMFSAPPSTAAAVAAPSAGSSTVATAVSCFCDLAGDLLPDGDEEVSPGPPSRGVRGAIVRE